jgi:hypothetical protein
VIEGRRVTLRPARLEDRRTVYEWGHHSDIAPLIHLSGDPAEPFETWCDDWKEHYFADASPDSGASSSFSSTATPSALSRTTTSTPPGASNSTSG